MSVSAATLPHAGAGASTAGGVRRVPTTRDDEFAAYMAARQPALLRTAYLLSGNRADAEDLVATALAKAWLAWDRVSTRESPDAYVRRILVNEHNSLWRRSFKRREHSTDEVPDRGFESPDYDDRDRLLWDFVGTLPRKQRAVVVLRYYEELSEAETATILGVSIGTVKSQASRALAALRERVPSALQRDPDANTPTSKEDDR